MVPLHSPQEYLFNLYTTSSGEARRLWRKHIKEKWNYQCAYCNSQDNITLDHIVPQSKGGVDLTQNIVCCCHSCNQSKGHTPWEEWYSSQEFFSEESFNKIKNWMKPEPPINLFRYGTRKNFIA